MLSFIRIVNCSQSLISSLQSYYTKPKHASGEAACREIIITSWFAIALDEIEN